jgi:SAM-dependent methyltransferase
MKTSPDSADAVRCFACGSARTHVFHSIDRVPVHSCLLMPTRNEAVDYPKGNLRIAFCPDCGFIQNNAFDASVHEYSPRYEETQAFSPRFRQFAHELAERYAAKFDIKGTDKTVLEIGCGKGEFLVELCETAGCSGIGIDPGCRPERIETAAGERLQWIQDFYGVKYTHLQADMVLCRHTLEHIQPVADFMRMVRESIGDREDTVVAFELPDTERILAENGFWDMYYEHCSYFTLGSLARLFKTTDFRVVELEKTFGEQYLLIDAFPTKNGKDHELPAAADDLQRTASLVAEFEKTLPTTLDRWKAYFADAKTKGEKVVLWGSGSKAVAFMTSLGLSDEVHCVTDINPYRHGMFMPGTGHEIVPPAELEKIKPQRVVAMNPIYLEEIGGDLQKMGLQPALSAV